MKLIDLHMLTDGDEQSPSGAVNFHKVPPIEGDLFSARVNGFSAGSAPYVSLCDPGDSVLPGIFESLEREIAEYNAVSTNSVAFDTCGGGEVWRSDREEWSIELHRRNHLCVHQITVVKRSVIEDAISLAINAPEEFRNISPNALIFGAVAKLAGWHFSREIGYVWRMTEGGFHTRATAEQHRALRDYINTSFLKG